jgi:hypothetical protein
MEFWAPGQSNENIGSIKIIQQIINITTHLENNTKLINNNVQPIK